MNKKEEKSSLPYSVSTIYSSFIDWDKKISQKIAEKAESKQLLITFIALSGNGQPWFIISFIFLIFNIFFTRTQNLIQIIVVLLCASATGIVKYSIKRERPDQTAALKYISKGDFYSFPSGHTVRAFSFAVLVTFYQPVLGWLFIFWAVAIAYSRIALNLHFVSDVLAGFVMGVLGGLIGVILYNHLSNLVSPLVTLLNSFLF
ncbi:MAG: phosphatase PAP2 family protein [Candidatus Heimdallarchaeaceae archaeon]